MLELRTMVDFGLVVLIWLVQLIIYPSFRYTRAGAFKQWHAKYTVRIAVIVAPLMIAQVALLAYQIYTDPHWAVYVAAFFVGLIWISTFFQAVPVHNILGSEEVLSGGQLTQHIERLITVNWTRTILWTLIFFLNLIR